MDGEDGATGFAVEADGAAMRVGDRLDDREAETAAASYRFDVDAIEAVENARLRVGRDAAAAVDDLEGDPGGIRSGGQRDHPAALGRSQGVLDERIEGAPQAVLVAAGDERAADVDADGPPARRLPLRRHVTQQRTDLQPRAAHEARIVRGG